MTAVVVETYDAQTGGTVPSRATQNQTGEKIGIRIGAVDATSLSNDVPDTVAQGAVDDNYSGIHASTLSDWVGKIVNSGGEIVVRHGSLYSGSSGDDSLTARSVTVTVQTCTPSSGGGGGGSTVTGYVWSPQSRLTEVSVNGDVKERMWYLAGGERLLHVDSTGIHLNLGGMLERHITPAGAKTLKRSYMIAGTLVAVRTIAAGVDDIHYLFGDVRGSTTMTIKRGTTSITEQQWYTAHGTTRGVNTITSTNRGYIGQETDTSGLNYLHNRYHDPTLGIFITVDPLVAKTGEPYLYASGNPTSLSDPSGLDPDDRGICDGLGRSACSEWVWAEYNLTKPLSQSGLPHIREKYERRSKRAEKAQFAADQLAADPAAQGSWWVECTRRRGNCGAPPEIGEYSSMKDQTLVLDFLADGGAWAEGVEDASNRVTSSVFGYTKANGTYVVAYTRYKSGLADLNRFVPAGTLKVAAKSAGEAFFVLDFLSTANGVFQDNAFDSRSEAYVVTRGVTTAGAEAAGGWLGGSGGAVLAGLLCGGTGPGCLVAGGIAAAVGTYGGAKAGKGLAEVAWNAAG